MIFLKIIPEILIISNRYDYATDHVTSYLSEIGASYLRLNRDQLSNLSISIIPDEKILYGETKNFEFKISPSSLKSIYFRAPTFLRNNYDLNKSPENYFFNNQWASFIRSLIIFEDILWVNHPQSTYSAEIKPYQLYKAREMGFKIPHTIITNSNDQANLFNENKLAIKTLDPMKLNIKGKEAFIFTNIIKNEDLVNEDISTAPVILQNALVPKVDIRATVVGDTVFAVSIKKEGKGINTDWRFEEGVQYEEIELPKDILEKCVKFTKELGLKFGGIDLALYDENYYFIEINPTGQWAWLMKHTNYEIDKEIGKLLIKGKKCPMKKEYPIKIN